ncbi:MAG: NADH-quinone oxidoreductase subunit M [Cyclobacteriaceae bacterium]|nr:NADH-quinone oxidoreductase subunit M [Cyclobacteriaceae bacterium]
MTLLTLIGILMIGGFLAWLSARWNTSLTRWISLMACGINLIWTLFIWFGQHSVPAISAHGQWILEYRQPWIERFGIQFYLALDGLSLLMLMLTFFLGFISVLVSWHQIRRHAGFYYFNLLWILAGITGVFLALDLFLFYFFWEIMLIPMYFLIGIWGYEKRLYAAYKFFLFTQASGLLMFLSILSLYFIHGAQTGVYTFDLTELMETSLSSSLSLFLMAGFLIAFLVKLPAVPFHNWLPDAHTEAPTAGSVILAGLLLKTGAYGLLRFVLPLFPEAVLEFAPWGMFLGAISILYGAKLAFSQTDLKRLVAYTSVSHMGFVLLGVFALNQVAVQGVVIQMIAHGISTGALFILVGSLQERVHTREISAFGGLWTKVPVMGSIALIFAMASLGLPGMGNFIAEFLILAGTFQSSVFFSVMAAVGLIAATLYSLRIFQQVFQGSPSLRMETLSDLNLREMFILGIMVILIFWLGLYPRPALDTSQKTIHGLLQRSEISAIPGEDPPDHAEAGVGIKIQEGE